MVSVDGSNIIKGIARNIGIDDLLGKNRKNLHRKPPKSVFELAELFFQSAMRGLPFNQLLRKYWFGSYTGDDNFCFELCDILRDLNFEPHLYKAEGEQEKGVDIGLTLNMLSNAFNQNFEIGLLIAGDEDYLELVNEVKRYGQIIHGAYFSGGLSRRLRLSFDGFRYLDGIKKSNRYRGLCARVKSDLGISDGG